AGPDPLALVASEAAAAQVVAAFAVADPALAAGAVADQPSAGAPGAGLGPSRDERPGGCQPGQGLGGRAGHEAAVQGDLAWPKAEAVQLGRGLGQQAGLGGGGPRGARGCARAPRPVLAVPSASWAT